MQLTARNLNDHTVTQNVWELRIGDIELCLCQPFEEGQASAFEGVSVTVEANDAAEVPRHSENKSARKKMRELVPDSFMLISIRKLKAKLKTKLKIKLKFYMIKFIDHQ